MMELGRSFHVTVDLIYFVSKEPYLMFLENGWNLPPKLSHEFRIVSEVFVSNVQNAYLIWTTLEVRDYVLAVDWFHDYD